MAIVFFSLVVCYSVQITPALSFVWLPEELVVMCRLTDLQVSVYKAILEHPDMQLVLQAEDPCDCASGKQRASCCYKVSVWQCASNLFPNFMIIRFLTRNIAGKLKMFFPFARVN